MNDLKALLNKSNTFSGFYKRIQNHYLFARDHSRSYNDLLLFNLLIVLTIGALVKTYTLLLRHHLRFYLTWDVAVINFSFSIFRPFHYTWMAQ